MFFSQAKTVAAVRFPKFSGVRVMMMPFHVEDPVGSLPSYLRKYAHVVRALAVGRSGVGYLTVDEAVVKAGEHHRRPGLHVDGAMRKAAGGWGGGGGGWGGGKGIGFGFIVAASKPGCVMYPGKVVGFPGQDGNCDHLRGELPVGREMQAGFAYAMTPLVVHETTPQLVTGPRQFLRISMPSDAPWYEGYSPNPLGIAPAGPILPRRSEQMAHRL
jgi:hypothetical protein